MVDWQDAEKSVWFSSVSGYNQQLWLCGGCFWQTGIFLSILEIPLLKRLIALNCASWLWLQTTSIIFWFLLSKYVYEAPLCHTSWTKEVLHVLRWTDEIMCCWFRSRHSLIGLTVWAFDQHRQVMHYEMELATKNARVTFESFRHDVPCIAEFTVSSVQLVSFLPWVDSVIRPLVEFTLLHSIGRNIKYYYIWLPCVSTSWFCIIYSLSLLRV